MITKSPEKPAAAQSKPVKAETLPRVQNQEQVQSSLRRLAASQAKQQSVQL